MQLLLSDPAARGAPAAGTQTPPYKGPGARRHLCEPSNYFIPAQKTEGACDPGRLPGVHPLLGVWSRDQMGESCLCTELRFFRTEFNIVSQNKLLPFYQERDGLSLTGLQEQGRHRAAPGTGRQDGTLGEPPAAPAHRSPLSRDGRKGWCLQTGALQRPCSDEVSPGKTATQGVTITGSPGMGYHSPDREERLLPSPHSLCWPRDRC